MNIFLLRVAIPLFCSCRFSRSSNHNGIRSRVILLFGKIRALLSACVDRSFIFLFGEGSTVTVCFVSKIRRLLQDFQLLPNINILYWSWLTCFVSPVKWCSTRDNHKTQYQSHYTRPLQSAFHAVSAISTVLSVTAEYPATYLALAATRWASGPFLPSLRFSGLRLIWIPTSGLLAKTPPLKNGWSHWNVVRTCWNQYLLTI